MKLFSISMLANTTLLCIFPPNIGDECVFASHFYPVGEEFSINNPCVKCSCIVPPDFTCVHQTCSPSPSEENCDAVYTEGECCPSYECMLGDAAESELLPGNCTRCHK